MEQSNKINDDAEQAHESPKLNGITSGEDTRGGDISSVDSPLSPDKTNAAPESDDEMKFNVGSVDISNANISSHVDFIKHSASANDPAFEVCPVEVKIADLGNAR